jgi:hypothetical protein
MITQQHAKELHKRIDIPIIGYPSSVDIERLSYKATIIVYDNNDNCGEYYVEHYNHNHYHHHHIQHHYYYHYHHHHHNHNHHNHPHYYQFHNHHYPHLLSDSISTSSGILKILLIDSHA